MILRRTGQRDKHNILEVVPSVASDDGSMGSSSVEQKVPAHAATQPTPAAFAQHQSGMQEGSPLDWDLFKAAVDDLAACESYGTCHPKFVFSSGLNDILRFCRKDGDGEAALGDRHSPEHQEDCFHRYMAHLLKAILYVEQSGYRGEKTFKSAAGAWQRWGTRPENWQTVNDSYLWQAVRGLDEVALPLFQALGWHTIDLVAGPPDNERSATLRDFQGGGIKVSELRSNQLLELVLG